MEETTHTQQKIDVVPTFDKQKKKKCRLPLSLYLLEPQFDRMVNHRTEKNVEHYMKIDYPLLLFPMDCTIITST